jgi:hypothetical protein
MELSIKREISNVIRVLLDDYANRQVSNTIKCTGLPQPTSPGPGSHQHCKPGCSAGTYSLLITPGNVLR